MIKLKNVKSIFGKNDYSGGVSKIQELLLERLEDILHLVIKDRRNDEHNSKLTPLDTDEIMKNYMMKNVALAAATSFVPGPAGMIAAVPTMLNSVSNQMKTTYDLACAYGKEELIVKDILIDVPLQAMGVSAGLAQIQELPLFEESNSKIISQKIHGFGKTIALKKIKGALTKLIPGMSTIFAITQAKAETAKVFATADTFFNPNAVLLDPIDPFITEQEKVMEERIKLLVNLLTLDSKATPEEKAFIIPIINESGLIKDKIDLYLSALGNAATDYTVNYECIKKSNMTEDAIVDMAVLTKRDGDIGPRELEYVQFAAEKLSIDSLVYESILN